MTKFLPISTLDLELELCRGKIITIWDSMGLRVALDMDIVTGQNN